MTKNVLKEYEDTALVGTRIVRAFLKAKSYSKDEYNKARIGATAMTGYARLRTTLVNEAALRIMTSRRLRGGSEPRRIGGA